MIVIVVRAAIIIFLLSANHYKWFALDGIDTYQYAGTLLWVYLLIGISLISNFRGFLLVTTPLCTISAVCILYLMASWPISDCECLKPFEWNEEFMGVLRMTFPMLMGIQFQNRTLVNQFTSRENEQI